MPSGACTAGHVCEGSQQANGSAGELLLCAAVSVVLGRDEFYVAFSLSQDSVSYCCASCIFPPLFG